MSMLTDFFVATTDELAAAFSNWLAVADEPLTREVQNPFTGETQIVPYWPPASQPTETVTPQMAAPNFGNLLRVQFKRVDHVKLARLNVILTGGEVLDRVRQLSRPARIDPAQTDETGLHRFDDAFVDALAALTDPVQTLQEWAATEEMEWDRFTLEDCDDVLRELSRLAQSAIETGRQMYFWWSL